MKRSAGRDVCVGLAPHTQRASAANSQGASTRGGQPPVSPVGDTDVAGMCSGADARSASPLVSVTLRFSVEGVGLRSDTVQILESLVWPLVTFRMKRQVPYTDLEFSRFLRSVRKTAKVLKRYESEDNREQTFCKYWLDVYMCRVFRDKKMPNRDTWIQDQLFSGWVRRLIARAIANNDVGLIYSLSKGSKRAWPSLGDVKKHAALAKHMERVQRPVELLPSDLEEAIISTSREIFRDLPAKPCMKFMPSISACLQASRRVGGALSLFKPYEIPWDSFGRVPGALPAIHHSLSQWRNREYQDALYHGLARLVEGSGTDVEVVAIPEPGKFRIITKGDGYVYTALQPFQGALLDCWKQSRFSTMRSDDQLNAVRRMDAGVPDCPLFVSVDYEAATDLLNRLATFAALPGNETFGEMARLSFAPGKVYYGDSGQTVRGVNAQYMGHPLSFPLLCVCNLAVLRFAASRWAGMGLLFERPSRARMIENILRHCLVNGDDMLFKAPSRHFVEVFLETAGQAGFKESVGKNYVSEFCCMINSQVFQRQKGRMVRVGYLNQKFLSGVSLKGGESFATPEMLGKDVSKMIDLYPPASFAVPAIFKRFKERTKDFRVEPNWYLPVHLGGYGVSIRHAPSSFHISDRQRRLASWCLGNKSFQLFRLMGSDLHLSRFAGAVANWKLVPEDENVENMEQFSDDWLARLAYAGHAADGSHPVSLRTFHWRNRDDKLREGLVKPLSDLGFIKWWSAKFVAYGTPVCPPMPDLRFFFPSLEDYLPSYEEDESEHRLFISGGGGGGAYTNSELVLRFHSEHKNCGGTITPVICHAAGNGIRRQIWRLRCQACGLPDRYVGIPVNVLNL